MSEQQLNQGDTVMISPTWRKDKHPKGVTSKGFDKTLDAHAKSKTKFTIHNITVGGLYKLRIYNLQEVGKDKPMDKSIYDGMLIKVGEDEK